MNALAERRPAKDGLKLNRIQNTAHFASKDLVIYYIGVRYSNWDRPCDNWDRLYGREPTPKDRMAMGWYMQEKAFRRNRDEALRMLAGGRLRYVIHGHITMPKLFQASEEFAYEEASRE